MPELKEEILRRAGTERFLIKKIKKRQLNFIGHILKPEDIERNCLLGIVEGERTKETENQVLDTLLERVGGGWRAVDLVRMADDRRK